MQEDAYAKGKSGQGYRNICHGISVGLLGVGLLLWRCARGKGLASGRDT
jgi:hypothetical protein